MARLRAFTLTESLVVLAVLAIGGATVAAAWAPSSARRSAEAYLAAVRGARIEALAGTPVAVRWDAEAAAFEVRRGASGCDAPVRARVAPEPRVAVVRVLRDGVTWLPDGTGRSCGGGGVYGGRVRFAGRHDAWDVVVASTGRLRIEAVP